MAMNNYMDFAENDYNYFRHSYESGFVANAMAADAQEICEKYMKHFIDTFCRNTKTQEEQNTFDSVMKTHNLMKLYRYIENNTECSFDKETKQALNSVNGFYFTARYPGDESIEVTKEDLDLCNEAVQKCRKEIFDIQEKLQSRSVEETKQPEKEKIMQESVISREKKQKSHNFTEWREDELEL